MKQKKVLFIIHLPPPIHGASLLGKFIYDSKIINTTYQTKYINLGTTKAFKDRKRITLRKLIHFIKLSVNCFFTNIFYNPDVVYLTLTSNGTGFYKDALIVFLLKLKGTQIIYHHHNKGVYNYQHKFLDNIFYKMVFRNAYSVVGSKWLYFDIEKYIDKDHIYYCANGIPVPNYPIAERKTTQGAVQILFLSNLIESKGVYTLLKACHYLNKKGVGFKCAYAGSEGDISACELQDQIDGFGLKDKVVYAGKKYGEDKHKAFQEADIFAFPTHYPNECFPLVILEAMQYSLPVISTPEGGVPDMVENDKNGFLIQQKDSKELAEKLELLINNSSLRHEMGQTGHKKYLKQFTVETYGNTIKNIIQDVLKRDKHK